MNADVEALAREMYDSCPTPKPDWDQLGEATQSVWLERAMVALYGDLA